MAGYPNPYYATGVLFILIGIVVSQEISWETAILPLALGCSISCKGISNRELMRTEDSLRDRIMGVSFFCPGLVQIRDMGRKLTGSVMIATYVACYLVLISLMFSFITMDDVGPRVLASMIVFAPIILLLDVVLCSIQSNEYCNQMGMPHIGGEFEGNWTDTALAYKVTVSIASAVSVVMLILILKL